jgi:two-component system sensor histidine kinase AlgZ
MPNARPDPSASPFAPKPDPGRGGNASNAPGGFRSTGFGPTGFGSTVFDALPEVEARQRAERSVFDVCHVGVVLRALLFVHGVLGIGVLFVAGSFTAWVGAFAVASSAALPGVLLWLLVACAARRRFGALPLAGQWIVAIGLGALSGAAGALLGWFAAGDVLAGPPWLAPALAGAGLAAAMFQWLQLRAQALLPADTTARLAELQSRIRPHFLFNALNTAVALVQIDPERAENVLEDLSQLFRVALAEVGSSVTLAEEIDLAKRYLAIEQVRFGERLAVSWDVDAATSQARVPPLVLQPLVENAVRHGIETSLAGGTVRVRAKVRHGSATVVISNSLPDTPGQPGAGIALANVSLLHDFGASLEIWRSDGQFHARVMVPL